MSATDTATAESTQWLWCEELDWNPTSPKRMPEPSLRNLGSIEDGPQEGDPLDAGIEEPVEPVGLIEYDEAADSENEHNFMAIKPWLGALYPPRKYRAAPYDKKDLSSVFTEANNNWGLPEVTLELDYVFGYRTRNTRNSAYWLDENRVVFFGGGVCIIYKIKEDDQDFYFGHDDDVVCIDYHAPSGLCASGSIGARDTVRLCIWDAQTQQTKHCITGFHRFAVTSVDFNPSGTMVVSTGLDEHHSVAVHSVETGLLLACSQVDKNRILQVRWNKSLACPDSESCFVTCGYKHVAFWTPAENIVKGGKYYEIAPVPVDKKLKWCRGTKCETIDSVVFTCVDFTPRHTLAAAVNGVVYAFDSCSFACAFSVSNKADKTPVQALTQLDPHGRSIAIGTKGGFVYFYDFNDDGSYAPSTTVTTGKGETTVNINLLDDATDNESDVLVNSVRSLHYEPSTKRLLVGTGLNHLYAVSLPTSTTAKPSSRTIVGAHWGLLTKPDAYGEIWGIEAHPSKQHLYSCAMDGTVREWDLGANQELKRMHVRYAAMCVSASIDETMIAVGHMNGSFTVVNAALDAVVWPNTRHRVRRVKDIQFSPNCRYIAVGAEMTIDVYAVTDGDPSTTVEGAAYLASPLAKLHKLQTKGGKIVTRVGTCRGHTSHVRHLDWNLASTLIQSTSTGYELLYHSAPDCRRVTGARHVADQEWWTQSCDLGWPVQGIWPRFADGTDINSCGKSSAGDLLAVTNDYGEVVVYNYPCVGSGLDKYGHMVHKPQGHVLKGHSSHVTNCIWSFQDEYLLTVGGADMCIFVWKVTRPANATPKVFVDAPFVRSLQKTLDDAMKKKMNVNVDMSPLSSGVLPREAMTAHSPEERLRQLQQRITQKQPPAEWQAECKGCGWEFDTVDATTCPRCMMPRRTQRGAEEFFDRPKIVKAPRGKRTVKPAFEDGFRQTAKEEEVLLTSTRSAFNPETSHVRMPTKSFQAQAREARKTREEMAKNPPPPVFAGTVRGGIARKATRGKATCHVDISSDDSDHDEKLIKAALSKAKASAAANASAPTDGSVRPGTAGSQASSTQPLPTKKRAKQTSGPDFRDV
jgi:WD40 repeat protein